MGIVRGPARPGPARAGVCGRLTRLHLPGLFRDRCVLRFSESDSWTPVPRDLKEDIVGRRGYPTEFRCKVLDLVEAGRSVADGVALNGLGTGVVDLAERAVEFYAARYGDYPPRVLAAEVARCRFLLIDGSATSTDTRPGRVPPAPGRGPGRSRPERGRPARGNVDPVEAGGLAGVGGGHRDPGARTRRHGMPGARSRWGCPSWRPSWRGRCARTRAPGCSASWRTWTGIPPPGS